MNKTKYLTSTLGIVLGSALLGFTTYGQPSVSVGVSVPLPSVEVVIPSVEIRTESDFYEPLAPQGEWVVVGSYGRCWRPGHVARDWRPYCHGNWERTDAGWYWVSDEPWAWATYHYGRWDYTDQYGWYWVPQTQWAPAWVSWHSGGGYIGWAPLQPSVRISANGFVGFNESRIPPRAFVFVAQGRFMEPIRPEMVAANNTTIIHNTTLIANAKFVNNAVINEGPAAAVIEKASGRKVAAVPVQELRHKEEAAIVSKQRTPASASEKQAPVRNEAGPAKERTMAPPAQSQFEKPAAATRESAKPVPKNNEMPGEKYKPVPPTSDSKPAADKQPAEPKADKHVSRQKEPARPANENVQRPAKEDPAASGRNEPNPADNGKDRDHEKRSKD